MLTQLVQKSTGAPSNLPFSKNGTKPRLLPKLSGGSRISVGAPGKRRKLRLVAVQPPSETPTRRNIEQQWKYNTTNAAVPCTDLRFSGGLKLSTTSADVSRLLCCLRARIKSGTEA